MENQIYDHVFTDGVQVLAVESCDEHEAIEMAQSLAQEYNGRQVAIARLVKSVNPRKCDYCGAILNQEYTCPDCG